MTMSIESLDNNVVNTTNNILSTSSLNINYQTTTNINSSQSKEMLEEKKRKLTLPLNNNNLELNSNTSSSNNSIGSNESSNGPNVLNGFININSNNSNASKKFKSMYHDNTLNIPNTHLNFNAETPRNKELIANLDMPTPHIERLLMDFNPNNANLLKTPGSALAILTPSTSLSFANIVNTTTSNNNNNNIIINNNSNNINNLNQSQTSLITPSITLTTPLEANTAYSNYVQNTNYTNENDFYNSTDKSGLTPNAATLIDPLNIFGQSIGVIMSAQNQQQQSQENLSTNSDVNTNNTTTNNNNNNYYVLQPISSDQKNITNTILSTSNNTNINNLNQMGQFVKKDELQTVPEHSNMFVNQTNKPNIKRKTTTKTTPTTTTTKLENSGINGMDVVLNDLKKEAVNPGIVSNPVGITTRRYTDRSTTSSTTNGDGNSTCDPMEQEDKKLEKKRERNREAARKCRTRKLEKIANLEQQVKSLTESNELQKSKNRALLDEINEIKLKLETHQKMHNCDLKIDNVNLY